jgi:1,2-diacylglycerol-3-alpha-glucose alpha-1,2-galactosyltransferase
MQKIKVNMISESTFTVQGHGVHTAFLEIADALNARPDIDLMINKFRRRAGITHIQTFGPYALLQLWFGSGKKVISVHVVPDSLVGSIAGAQYFYGLAKWYMRVFYSRADLLLPVSKMVDTTLRVQLRIKKPSQVLYNTVDMDAYKAAPSDRSVSRTALALPKDGFVVVSCAQLQPRKRFDVFCNTAKALPDTTFIWIGGIPFKHLGADYGHMQKLLDEKPANVTVTGVIDHDGVRRYLQAADVFFLPSEQENHPMAVLEAAGAGLPLVVRDIPEYNDTFKDDVIRGKDATFVELIDRLCNDKAFRDQAKKGSAAIARRFDSRAGAERLVEAYKKVLGQ